MPGIISLLDALTSPAYSGWKFTRERVASAFSTYGAVNGVPSLMETSYDIVETIANAAVTTDMKDPALLVIGTGAQASAGNLGLADYSSTTAGAKAFYTATTSYHGYEPIFAIVARVNIVNGASRGPTTFAYSGVTMTGAAISRTVVYGPYNMTDDNGVVTTIFLPSTNTNGQDRYSPFAFNGALSTGSPAVVQFAAAGPTVTATLSSNQTVTYELLARGHRDVQGIIDYKRTYQQWVADWAWKGRRAYDTASASGTTMLEDRSSIRAYTDMVNTVREKYNLVPNSYTSVATAVSRSG